MLRLIAIVVLIVTFVGGLLITATAWAVGWKLTSPPIEVTFRDSMVEGGGKVAILRNPTMHHLYDVHFVVTSPRNQLDPNHTGASKRIDNDMEPSEVTEIGWMELSFWKLEPGESVYIYADNFAFSKSVVVPQ